MTEFFPEKQKYIQNIYPQQCNVKTSLLSIWNRLFIARKTKFDSKQKIDRISRWHWKHMHSVRASVHCNLLAYEKMLAPTPLTLSVDFRLKRRKQTIINGATTQNRFCTNKDAVINPTFCRTDPISFFRKFATMLELCRNAWTMICLCCSAVGSFYGCRWGSGK